jgi:peptidoglycan/LPS O-acetylase OafA/YrhL
LRGIAALVVVFHHSLLVLPDAANLSRIPPVGSSLWWLEFTPLKLLTAGNEAVLVFFVLSGFVLVIPVVRRSDYNWVAYYFRRSVRLYLPVVASVAFAAICILVYPQTATAGGSSWVESSNVTSPSWGVFVQALDIFEPSNPVNNPLWTLRWEMIFSISLPLFSFGALLLRRRWPWVLVGSLALVGVGTVKDVQFLLYLPVFLCGSILAVNAERLIAWARSIDGRRGAGFFWFAALVGGCLLLVLHWLVQPLVAGHALALDFFLALSFLGAVVIVAVAFLWEPLSRGLTVAPVRWLGRVSFSLYLVHVPIIVACANIFGKDRAVLAVAVAIPVSLVVAEIFMRLVESPAHRLSRRVGAAISLRVAARQQTDSS